MMSHERVHQNEMSVRDSLVFQQFCVCEAACSAVKFLVGSKKCGVQFPGCGYVESVVDRYVLTLRYRRSLFCKFASGKDF